MGFFPAVSPVLAGLDQRGLAANPEDWDTKVAEAVRGFSTAYGNGALLERNRALIDYGSLATQAAYVFMYVAGHADFLNQVLTRRRLWACWLERPGPTRYRWRTL